MTTYAFRLPPGPDTVAHAKLAEELGYESVWCPEIPAFGHDIWITLARIAENTSRIGIGASVLIPSYRHPMAQASAKWDADEDREVRKKRATVNARVDLKLKKLKQNAAEAEQRRLDEQQQEEQQLKQQLAR